MKKASPFLLVLILLMNAAYTNAQLDTSSQKYRISIFAPLYLDSAFDAMSNYRFDKNFPKFLNPGLEFFEGAQLALDSLQKEGYYFEVSLYDSRSATKSLAQITDGNELDNTDLIIGNVTASDLRMLATVAYRKKIPFINATYPNDGNIVSNPSLVLLNSTMMTHCKGLYNFLQKNYGTSTILYFKRKGGMEDRLKAYFMEIAKTTAAVPLKMKFITVDEKLDAAQLATILDSNIQNVCLTATLDENFSKYFCQQAAALGKSYRTTIIGMPTWDNINEYDLPDDNNVEIVYSTPFYINPNDNVVKSIQQYFKTNLYMRPSDMVMRGFETTYHFGKLLKTHGKLLYQNIGDKRFNIINNFDIQPIYLSKQTASPDYYENKKLYYVKKVNDKIVAVY
jgi:hypothetical protein